MKTFREQNPAWKKGLNYRAPLHLVFTPAGIIHFHREVCMAKEKVDSEHAYFQYAFPI